MRSCIEQLHSSSFVSFTQLFPTCGRDIGYGDNISGWLSIQVVYKRFSVSSSYPLFMPAITTSPSNLLLKK